MDIRRSDPTVRITDKAEIVYSPTSLEPESIIKGVEQGQFCIGK